MFVLLIGKCVLELYTRCVQWLLKGIVFPVHIGTSILFIRSHVKLGPRNSVCTLREDRCPKISHVVSVQLMNVKTLDRCSLRQPQGPQSPVDTRNNKLTQPPWTAGNTVHTKAPLSALLAMTRNTLCFVNKHFILKTWSCNTCLTRFSSETLPQPPLAAMQAMPGNTSRALHPVVVRQHAV